MKRILLVLSISLAVISSGYSQMNTGSLFALGVAELKMEAYANKEINSDIDPVKYLEFAFNPAVGYFFANRIAAGLMMSYAYQRIKYEAARNISLALLMGPFARYYIEYGAIVPFAELFLGFGRDNNKTIYDGGVEDLTNPHNLFKTWIGIGAAYFITEYIAAELMLKYFYETRKPVEGSGDGQAYYGLILCVGFALYFGSI